MTEFNTTELVAMGVAAVAVVITAIAIAMLVMRRPGTLPTEVLDQTRRARQRTYQQAEKDLASFRRDIRKAHRNGAVIIDLVCDLGDQWEDRDAPRFITHEQAIQAQQSLHPLMALKRQKKLPTLVIILHTFGGYSLAAQLIASAVNAYEGPKVAYVPYIAMSGGTKIALAAEKIVMGPTACLGPIDTQHGGVSNRNLQALRNDEKLPAIPPNFLVAMYEADKFDSFAVDHAEKIIHPNHTRSGKKPDLARFLASGEWSHSRPIYLSEAVEALGLNAKSPCPDSVLGYVDARIRMIDTQIEREAKAPPAPSATAADDGPVSSDSALKLKVTA